MGACSSKPKTTEFEGSTEPSKQTEDVPADRSIDVVNATQVSQQNEPGKAVVGAADADAKALQEERELVASMDEEPSTEGLLSTEEGVSQSVKGEAGVVVGESAYNTVEKGNADTEDAQKVNEGVGAASVKEVSDKAITVDDGVYGDQDKYFEDKAVVLDEAAGSGGISVGNACTDKAVGADEEKVQESGGNTAQDEQSRNLQDVKESPGVESPVIGLVQASDPIDVSESVSLAAVESPAHVDSMVSKSPVEIERGVSAGSSTREDDIAYTEKAANPLAGPSQETPDENEETLDDNSKGSPLVGTSSSDGDGQQSGVDNTRCEEVPVASADAQDEMQPEDTIKPETVQRPLNDTDERTSEPHEENALEECAEESREEEDNAEVASESQSDVRENEGNTENVHVPEPEFNKVVRSIDAKTYTEPLAETTLVESGEGQDEGIAGQLDARDVQAQTLAMKEPAEDDKPVTKPDEPVVEPSAETERAEKVEKPHIEEAATNKEKVEGVDAGIGELVVEQAKNGSGENDLAFEDASDVPLRVESGTIESGHTPNS